MIRALPRARRLLPRVWVVALTALATLTALTGCAPAKYPVEGKVLWSDGGPATELAGGEVIFESKDAPVSARGEIQADGSFRLTTQRPDDGVLPGSYRVLITEPLPQDSDRVPPPKMDPKFQSFDTSGLEFTVQAGRNEPIFKVQRAAGRKPRR